MSVGLLGYVKVAILRLLLHIVQLPLYLLLILLILQLLVMLIGNLLEVALNANNLPVCLLHIRYILLLLFHGLLDLPQSLHLNGIVLIYLVLLFYQFFGLIH